MENQENINQLAEKLDRLMKQQEGFLREIYDLKQELNKLKSAQSKEEVYDVNTAPIVDFPVETPTPVEIDPIPVATPVVEVEAPKPPQKSKPFFSLPEGLTENFEQFIGENLISKIGILITVIGVGIGAKYAIDNELISPLTRIILGYLVGLGLLGFAIQLKPKYANFSAVLLSGAMAILYFITFAAYSFYAIIPQTVAFLLMVFFTLFTVLAAMNYNKQIIAHIGLVGAYAVPFLLSNDTGQSLVLFSYMAIINAGILFIAFRRNWKPLFYVAFTFTWLIFFAWYDQDFEATLDLTLGLSFSTVFFLLFYATFLAYKLVNKEVLKIPDSLILVFNAFIYYFFGFAMLEEHPQGEQLLGVFTLLNAIVHFAISAFVYKQKIADRSLLYLLSGLVLVFITITIPVQLEGNWVTLLWLGLTVLLFWLGRTKAIPFYEKCSYPLLFLSFFSLVIDWFSVDFYGAPGERDTPFLNITFLTGLVFIAGLAYILWLNAKKEYTSLLARPKKRYKFMAIAIPTMLLIVLYNVFQVELSGYWTQKAYDANVPYLTEGGYESVHVNTDIRKFETIWMLNYTLLFLTLLAFANIKWIKNRALAIANLALNILVLITFLSTGVYILSQLQDSFVTQELGEHFIIGPFNIGIRYVSYLFVAAVLFATHQLIKQDFLKMNLRLLFDLVAHITVLWIASSELIHWLSFYGNESADKLGLSILWGIYALFLIVLGIWKKKSHLRLGSMLLFGITLIKLFFYDLVHLNTISKTIVFVSLGILLLIISFLYNKYKNVMFEEEG